MNWDEYWAKNEGKNLYSFFAQIYRKHIFQRMLSGYFRRYFSKEGVILHAGAGSGQVDEVVAKSYKIVALDISTLALKLYRKNVPFAKFLVKGTIFQLPFQDNCFDGVYNLGVFEHFEKGEIGKALGEIKRVLKPGGRAIIFWPPEFGITVIFLKFVHFVMHSLGKKGFQVHPPEVSRLKSKKEAEELFSQAGFEVEAISFNLNDFFTMFAIVAKKR